MCARLWARIEKGCIRHRKCPHVAHSLMGRHQGGTQAGPQNRVWQGQGEGVYKLLREPKERGTYLSVGWGWDGLQSVSGGSAGRKEMSKVKEVGEGFPGRRSSMFRGANRGERQNMTQSRSCGSEWKTGSEVGVVGGDNEGGTGSDQKSLSCHEQGWRHCFESKWETL